MLTWLGKNVQGTECSKATHEEENVCAFSVLSSLCRPQHYRNHIAKQLYLVTEHSQIFLKLLDNQVHVLKFNLC